MNQQIPESDRATVTLEIWQQILAENGFVNIKSISPLLVTGYDSHCYFRADYNNINCFIKCRVSKDIMEKEYGALKKLYQLYPDYFPMPVLYKNSDGNKMFLAIEYLEGDELSEDLIMRSSPDKRKRMFDSICKIAEILFEQKLIHRDFHCGNLMVPADGTIKLFDFQHVLGEGFEEDELNLQNPKRLRGTNKRLRPAPYLWDDMYSAYKILKMFEKYEIPEFAQKTEEIKSKIGKLRNDFLKNKFPMCAYWNYKGFIFYKISGLFRN